MRGSNTLAMCNTAACSVHTLIIRLHLVPAALCLRLVQQLVCVLLFVLNLMLEVRRVSKQQRGAVLFPPQEHPEPGC